MPGKIRFGMVGTGFIADWVLAGARQDARFEAVAICSRTQERADAFAAKHGIPHTFTLLEEMAASPLVDAVYIATPNFLHASQSILCMRHGKHVLCEKPLASNAREARQMVAVARECGEVLGPEGVGYVPRRAGVPAPARDDPPLFRQLLPVLLALRQVPAGDRAQRL